MKNVIIALLALFPPLVIAQTNQGPTNISKLNSTIYIGSTPGWYATIQSGVTAACALTPNTTIVIPAGYGGSDAIGSLTGGCTKAYIQDQRVVAQVCYAWDGSIYGSTSCGSGGSTGAVLLSPGAGVSQAVAQTTGTAFSVEGGAENLLAANTDALYTSDSTMSLTLSQAAGIAMTNTSTTQPLLSIEAQNSSVTGNLLLAGDIFDAASSTGLFNLSDSGICSPGAGCSVNLDVSGISGGLKHIVVPNASGTLALTSEIPVASGGYTSVVDLGDSITQATGTSCFMQPGIKGQPVNWPGDLDLAAASCLGPTGYAYLLQSDFGNAGVNCGRGGDLSTDMAWHAVLCGPRSLTQNNPVHTAMIGTNDNSACGTNTNCQDTSLKAELFSAAEILTPDSLKSFASSCSTTGTWVSGDVAGSMATTTNGSTMTCTFPSSTAIAYVAYEKCDNTSNGTGTLTVNGSAGALEPNLIFYGLGSSNIFWSNQTSFASGSGQFSHCTLALARNTGIAGSNSITFTSTGTGKAEIFWMAGSYVAPPGTVAPPLYVQNGVPFEVSNGGQPGVGEYNTISNTVSTTLSGDGQNILWGNVQATMNTTVDFTGGAQASGDAICGVNSPSGAPWAATWATPLHPGDGGACHIYEADRIALAAAGVLPSVQSQALQIWAGPSGVITGANSMGGRYGADGGLNGVQPLSVLDFTQTGYGSAVGTDFTVPGMNTIQLRYQGTNNPTPAYSGLFGAQDLTTGIYHWVVGADGTMCFNLPGVNGASCTSGSQGYTTFFNSGGVTGGASAAINRVQSLSTTNPVAGYQLRAPGMNSVDFQGFGTGTGSGIAGCVGIFDETTSTFAWVLDTADNLYGYTPPGNCNTGVGATWSILNNGHATFSTINAVTINATSNTSSATLGSSSNTNAVLTATNDSTIASTTVLRNYGAPTSGTGLSVLASIAPNLANGSLAYNYIGLNGTVFTTDIVGTAFSNMGGTGSGLNYGYFGMIGSVASTQKGIVACQNGSGGVGYTETGATCPTGATPGTWSATALVINGGTALNANQGTGASVQHSTGTVTTGDLAYFDSTGNTTDSNFNATGGTLTVANGQYINLAMDGTGGIECNGAASSTTGSYLVLSPGGCTFSPSSLLGTTGSIGGSLLTAGTCASGTVSVTNALPGYPVAVSSDDGSLPSPLAVLSAAVTSTGTVTVQVCAIAAVTPAAKSYNVTVFPIP